MPSAPASSTYAATDGAAYDRFRHRVMFPIHDRRGRVIAFDIDLIHFGVLMVIAVVIGQLTPPMAIALIITSRIAEVDMIKIMHANWPFFISIIIFMFILMAVPELATWLPSQMRD